MDRTASIRRQFGAAAAAYAGSCVHRSGPDLDAMLAAVGIGPETRVLDVGCGAGHTALAFAARGARVTGLDLTDSMLEQARGLAEARGLAVRLERGDAEALPFPDASFDVVAARQCAHHFGRPDRAVAEAERVLVPGGALLVLDSVSLEDPAQDTFLNCIELLRDPSHVRDHSITQWHALLAGAGLRGELLGTWSLRIDFDDWVERMGTPPATVTELRRLLAEAPDEVRLALAIDDAGGFDMPAALLRGTKDREARGSAPR